MEKLIIPFAEKSSEYKDLKKTVDRVTDFNLVSFFNNFYQKIRVQKNEFKAFLELFEDFSNFFESQRSLQQEIIELEEEKAEVENK